MAPEQARGKAVDRRADIWAFGAVLYEMLTGRRAFEGDDLSVTLEDRTGLVHAFGPAQPGQFNLFDGVKADRDPTVIVVTWLGGICDRTTHLVFAAVNGDYSVTETTEREAACRDASIRRTVSIGLASPIDASTVTLLRRPHIPVASPPV